MICNQSKITMHVKKVGKIQIYISLISGEKIRHQKHIEMMELVYKKVETAIINMFHMLRNIQKNKHDGGKVKDITINLQIQETQQILRINIKEKQTEANYRLMAENQEQKNLQISCEQVKTKRARGKKHYIQRNK